MELRLSYFEGCIASVPLNSQGGRHDGKLTLPGLLEILTVDDYWTIAISRVSEAKDFVELVPECESRTKM